MDQKVKQLLLQTLSPHENLRNGAEAQLKALEKNVDFINFIRNVLMKEPQDKQMQQISSIYFMNNIERNWNAPEIRPISSDIEENILSLLKIEDKYPKIAYQRVLQCIFEKSEKSTIESIFMKSGAFLSSTSSSDCHVALLLYEEVFKAETLKYNLEGILDIIFNKYGNILTIKFSEFLANKRYSHAALCMKIVAKSYLSYNLPDFLHRIDVAIGFFNLAIQILNIEEKENDGLSKMQRWASYFLYKFSNKGLKKYFKNGDMVDFVKKEETLSLLFTTFSKFLAEVLAGKKHHSKVPMICSDFFCLFAGHKHTRHYIKTNYMFLLTSFIFPHQSFDEKLRDCFEYDPNEYLRERYNYNNSDIRSCTAELFEEILLCDKDIEAAILNSLVTFLNSPTDDTNAHMRFGVIGLLANSQKNLIKVYKEEGFYELIRKHIFPDLKSPHEFLVSQSLYFLSLTEQIDISDNSILEALNLIVSFTVSDHQTLPVEACLSLNVFFYNDSLKSMFKPIIASLFEKTLLFSKIYFLESLSTLMDSIIDCFNDEITICAPEFVKSIVAGFMDKIESENQDKFAAISGYITTIEKLVITAEDKPDIVKSLYQSASAIVFYIFKNNKTDFFQESFDLINSFLFVLKQINESMFEIFTIALSVDKDELSLYPREIGDFIDNYLSFGRDSMINPTTVELIYNIIDMFMPIDSSESDLYDEDFEAACRIIDSLMLNAGVPVHSLNHNIIPAILHKIVSNYDLVCSYSDLPLFALESIMNCFIVSPEASLAALGSFTPQFFNEIYAHKNKFKRVYDKKLFVVFIGHIFKLSFPAQVNHEHIAEVFSDTLCTLSDAIKKRHKLIEEANNDEMEEEYSDGTAESIPEDIYFETVLDNFDAYEYTRKLLTTIVPKTFGEKLVSSMSSSQVSRIKTALETSAQQ